jgi:hypothetical protein
LPNFCLSRFCTQPLRPGHIDLYLTISDPLTWTYRALARHGDTERHSRICPGSVGSGVRVPLTPLFGHLSRFIGYRLPRSSAGAFLLVAPAVSNGADDVGGDQGHATHQFLAANRHPLSASLASARHLPVVGRESGSGPLRTGCGGPKDPSRGSGLERNLVNSRVARATPIANCREIGTTRAAKAGGSPG